MSTSSFLRADGTLDVPQPSRWSGWLPARSQMEAALRLGFNAPAVNAPTEPADADTIVAPTLWDTSMRQALGLVVVAGLVAGVVPFVVNWVAGAQAGGILPLRELAAAASLQQFAPLSPLWAALQDLGGLQPAVFPAWLAAMLAALGAWINTPLNWLTWWIVYGAAVLLTAKAWGAPTTLQQFYASTGYAALPLLLTGLGPIPCLGQLAAVVGVAAMLVMYTRLVAAVTGLNLGRALIAVLLPGAVVGMLALMAGLSLAATLLRFAM